MIGGLLFALGSVGYIFAFSFWLLLNGEDHPGSRLSPFLYRCRDKGGEYKPGNPFGTESQLTIILLLTLLLP